jgi:peroxiredoxin
MKQKIYLILSLLLLLTIPLTTFSFGSEPKKVENFKLKDYNGKEYQLTDFKKSKATVIMFIATQCPVSNGYNTRMAQLYTDYKDKGVTFLGINSNMQESVDEIKDHAKSNKLDFIILKDQNNVIADKFDASFTPEIYVLNGNSEILYHGRIDDSRRESDVKTKDLRAALDEILSGKKVSAPETKAFGCSIKRSK